MKARNLPAIRSWILLCTIAISQGATAQEPDPRQVWSAGGGTMTLEVRGDYLPDFGIEIIHEGREIDTRRRVDFFVAEDQPFRLEAPRGGIEKLRQDAGRLAVRTDLVFRRGALEVDLDEIFLIPGEAGGHPQFVAVDVDGNELFRLTHIHMLAHPESGLLTVANAEVIASKYLSRRLGLGALAGMPIAIGWLDLDLAIPAGARTSGEVARAGDRPYWPQQGQFEADVTLIGMDTVAYQGSEPGTGLIKIAPSATLKNESLADVPWIAQFTSHPDYPYAPADQHPFLVWNIYAIADGRIRMLADSGVKHAFQTINQNCDINPLDGHILGPGCEDVYSSGNNDSSTHLGPRDEVEASLGLWDNCGSFFDPGCTGSQTQYSGQWLNRLLIDPAEFGQPDTQYFLDAWYVIQYDVNIWNGMGFRPIDPAPSGAGWIMNAGPYRQGPAISQWVAENESDPLAAHAVITIPSETPGAPYPDNMPQGHMRLLVKVTETQPGRYRYSYALQNYDFDRGLEAFHIGLTPDATIHDSFFGDIDSDATNDWSFSVNNGSARFDAPVDNPLTWSTLFNFEIETDALPVASTVTLNLGVDAVQPSIDVTTIGPAGAIDLIFGDRFAP